MVGVGCGEGERKEIGALLLNFQATPGSARDARLLASNEHATVVHRIRGDSLPLVEAPTKCWWCCSDRMSCL